MLIYICFIALCAFNLLLPPDSSVLYSSTAICCFSGSASASTCQNFPSIAMPKTASTTSRGLCNICGRDMPLRSDGKVRTHGPVSNRCPGSDSSPVRAAAIDTPASHLVSQPSAVSSSSLPPNTTSVDPSTINPGRCIGKIIKRIPRGSRHQTARKLSNILDDIIANNSNDAWERLFLFPRRCLQVPKRGGRRRNLANFINQAVSAETDVITIPPPAQGKRSNLDILAARVSAKLEDGDFRGAVRIASSNDTFCVPDERSLNLLREKHPPSNPDCSFPEFQSPDSPLEISTLSVRKAIYSFPSGSAGGQDGLLPQHLKDLICTSQGVDSSDLLTSLTKFINMIIAGKVPLNARPFFFGASLIGLNKSDGGIRPIAVGCTLRRLAAKCVCAEVKEAMGSLLFPRQLGFGSPMGAEAIVHAARSYLNGLEGDRLMFKLDFKNAFNSIRRDLMLSRTLEKVPVAFPLAYISYRQPSFLFHGEYTIESCEGVQQGDPLGPLLFCIAIHDLINTVKSEFSVFYLDDGILGGSSKDVISDLKVLEERARHIGLVLNHSKSECICKDPSTRDQFLAEFPSVCNTIPEEATLLGSPIGGLVSINNALETKISDLEILGERLEILQAHDALCLLRNAFSLPKLLYILRTAPCFQSPLLTSFDDLQRRLLESICNVPLTNSNWMQTSLPITFGGIGIRSAALLAPSAYLASAAGCSSTSLAILPSRLHVSLNPLHSEALQMWKSLSPTSLEPPIGANTCHQKHWDLPLVKSCFSSLLSAADSSGRTRLLASQQKEAGAWLCVPPVSSLGLRMCNDSIRVAVGLRLGVSLCTPHLCSLCKSPVDASGVHGLSCRMSKGRLPRHSALNNIIHRALSAANIPSTLEPRGLCRLDGKRPDGLTITPWSKGRALVWDVTCWDSFATSNTAMSSSHAGRLADFAATRKRETYKELSISHHFQPIAFESTGAFGQDALEFVSDLARRSRLITNDPLSYLKICQQISVCIQNFNTISILGCHSTL